MIRLANGPSMYIATRVRASLAPHILGDGLYERDLSPLLFLGELVAFLSGGETALGGQAQTVERHILGRFGNAGLDRFRIFQFRLFGGNQPSTTCLSPETLASGSKSPERSSSNSK